MFSQVQNIAILRAPFYMSDDVCFIDEYNVNVLEWKDKVFRGLL